MSDVRQELVEELNKIIPCSCIEAYTSRSMSAPDCANCNYVEELADFIIQDRKKIISPIKEALRFYENVKGGTVPDNKMVNELVIAIRETLKNAGVEI